jgi:hypothetical protein
MGLIDQYAAKGRKGDTMMAHLTPGEVVIPKEVAAMRPDLVSHLYDQMRKMGADPKSIVAGQGRINPKTGIEEFATSDEVNAAYNQYLGRDAEASGMAHQSNAVDSGNYTMAQVIDSIKNSPEAARFNAYNANQAAQVAASFAATAPSYSAPTPSYSAPASSGMTANQAAELMRRSQTTGAPTSEFDAGGGYDAVVALAKGNTTGYQYGVRTVEDMAQYAPNDAVLRVEAGTYPGGANQTFYASGNSASGGVLPIKPSPAQYSGATQATQTPWDVTPNQTVQQQTEDIVAKDSPLMQQARSLSNQQMNARGLINSSMAIGAGEDAVLGKAIQIGAQDANTYASSAQANAASANALAQFNASQSNAWNTNALDRALSVSQSALNRGSTASEAALNRSATTSNAELDNSFRVQASSDAAFNEQYRMYVDALYKIDINPDLDAQAKVLLKEAQAATLKSYANVRNLNLDLSFL